MDDKATSRSEDELSSGAPDLSDEELVPDDAAVISAADVEPDPESEDDYIVPTAMRYPLALAALIVVVDQITKHWALNRLSEGRIIEVVWTLQFNLAFNSGMAFSAGRGLGPLIGVAVTGIIVYLVITLRKMGGRLNVFGLGCILGGAVGNLIDRLFRGDAWLRGSVVDFIDFQWFPVFNIADVAVNVGAAALILNAVLLSRRGV